MTSASSQVRDRNAATTEVVNALRRLLRGLRVAAGATQASSGISAAQLFVLAQLEAGEARSIRELAEATLTDRTSVAAVVERLVARGLAERTQARTDRRRAEVRITVEGQKLLRDSPLAPTAQLMSAVERLSERRLFELAGSLNALIRELGLESSPAVMLFEDEEAEG